ncbi:MAG: hypothetical protein SFY70_00210 [Bacteroidia bacterium]|nr:hypothetical protein [Bacteroidia bacterium]
MVRGAKGVHPEKGGKFDATHLERFTVTLVQGTDTLTVHPFQLADMSDNDNNLDLCLKQTGTPIRVRVEANTALDPRNDKNPATEVAIVSRW